MKVVIDGRMYNESGIGRYIRNLIDNLQLIDKENEYFILHLKDDFYRLKYNENFHKVIADFKWYGVGEQLKLLKLLKLLRPDLTHFPHFNVPIFYQDKFVVTIHDLIHQHFSMERATSHGLVIYKLKQFGYRKVFNNVVKKAEKLFVPSHFVKSQLINDWKIDSGKMVVTHEAVDEEIVNKCQMSNIKCQMLLRKLDIRKPYVFYVGNAHPHKNVEGLIRAFRDLREKYTDLLLVLSGNDHYFWQNIKSKFSGEGIIYTGHVSDEQLAALYSAAECFVMPSLEEGFGIPILEAMASSCPVVSSDAGSLPEVGGDACLYFNPNNTEDMVSKIDQVLKSDSLRKSLVAKGKIRVKNFSWKRLAEKTLEVYQQCG